MNFSGPIIGIASFFCIGIFHPIVIKAEYHYGKGCWWIFAVVGTAAVVGSLCVSDMILSTILGVFAFSCYWSIPELFAQEKRVERGWFPKNPKKGKKKEKENKDTRK